MSPARTTESVFGFIFSNWGDITFISQNVPKAQAVGVGGEYRKVERALRKQELHIPRSHQCSDLKPGTKSEARLGTLLPACPHLGALCSYNTATLEAVKDKPCKRNGEVSQPAQQYLVISKSVSQTQRLLPRHKPQQRSIEEDSEKAPAGVSLVQGDSSTCFTVTAETLQQYNCVSITSGGNGNLGVIAS